MTTLRPYQIEALEAVAAAQAAGKNRLLVQAATGTGKTTVFSSLLHYRPIRAWLDTFPESQRKMLVIAHREELIDQAAERIQRLNPGVLVSIEQGDRHANHYSDVVIASIQTLSAMKYRRLHRLLSRSTFRLVVYDESHHASSPTARTALVHLGFLPPADASDKQSLEAPAYDDVIKMTAALAEWDRIAPTDRLLVGFTATPNRSDAIGLGCVFQEISHTYPIKQAVEDGYLVPIVPWVVESRVSLDEVKLTAGEFNQKDLAAAVNNEARNQLAVAAWGDHALGLSTIAFTVDVAHAHSLAEEFRRQGVNAVALSGETPKEERRGILRDYSAGYIQVVCNCMVLTEGTDLPLTGCILHCKPTKSATLYEQMTGRGLRIHPDKRECILIDVVDIARKHSLQTAPVLYGLPPGINVNGRPLGDVERDLEALREAVPNFNIEDALRGGRLTLEQLKAKASTFNVWQIASLGAFGKGRALDWIKVGDDLYRISYPWLDGHEILQISRDMLGHFDVSLTLRPKEGAPRQRTLAAGVKSADEAAGMAEAFVLGERRDAAHLRRKNAPWKQAPASEKQLRLLRLWRIPFRPAITMGEASNLIDLAKARKQQGWR